MAKLKTPLMAGYNAGKNYFAKNVLISDIIIDPDISKLFKVNETLLDEITQKMLTFGYDESQPVVLQKGTMILLDGHTRLAAAKAAGLEEISAVDREFEDRESAIMYTFERQALRRNLTGAEILTAAQMLYVNGRKKHDGTGRAAEQLAKRLNKGVATIYKAEAILKSGNEEVIEAVKNGNMSIKKGHAVISGKPKQEIEFMVNDASSLPGPVKFLKAAIIHLMEAGQKTAADLLISHFLRKNERDGFYKLLPASIKEELEKGFAIPGIANNP
jgi:ParB family chromosome partitioning protein